MLQQLNLLNVRRASVSLYTLTLLFLAPLPVILWSLPFTLFAIYYAWVKMPMHLVVLNGFDDDEVIAFVEQAEDDFDAVVFVRKTKEDD